MISSKSVWLDQLGICLSLCCGIHCLATVAFLAVGALEMLDLMVNEQLESALSVSVLLIGMAALLPQLIARRAYGLLGLFIGGFILLKTSEGVTVLWIQVVLLSMGVLALTGAHYLNLKSKRKQAVIIKTAQSLARLHEK